MRPKCIHSKIIYLIVVRGLFPKDVIVSSHNTKRQQAAQRLVSGRERPRQDDFCFFLENDEGRYVGPYGGAGSSLCTPAEYKLYRPKGM